MTKFYVFGKWMLTYIHGIHGLALEIPEMLQFEV